MLGARKKQEWRARLDASPDEAIVEWVELGQYFRQYDRKRLAELIDWWGEPTLHGLCGKAEAGDAFSSSMIVAIGSLMAASPRIDGHVTRAADLLQRAVPGLAPEEDDELVALALANLTVAQARIVLLRCVLAATLLCARVAARDKGKSLSQRSRDSAREALAEAEKRFSAMQATWVRLKASSARKAEHVQQVEARVSEAEKMMDRTRRCATDDDECRRLLAGDAK